MQALKDKPKTSRLPHHPLPNYALRNLAGFADKAMFVDSAQSQTREALLVGFFSCRLLYVLVERIINRFKAALVIVFVDCYKAFLVHGHAAPAELVVGIGLARKQPV